MITLPLMPYRVLHVLGSSSSFSSLNRITTNYQTLPLRYSTRIVLKAMLRNWSLLFLVISLGIIGVATFFGVKAYLDHHNVQRVFNGLFKFPVIYLPIPIGIAMFVMYWWLDRSDDRIKSIIGLHEMGYSDPYHWPDDVAQTVAQKILRETGFSSLAAAVEAALKQDDLSTAMFRTRIAQRVEPQSDTTTLLHEVMRRA